MSKENAELIRRAYQAYASGDLAAMLELVDPGLEWTYLDPALEHPSPQVCHGRQELEQLLQHWAEHGVRAELEEVAGSGELVMVGVRTPGVDAHRAGAGMTASTACSPCVRDGLLPCVIAATGRRPCSLPASSRDQPSDWASVSARHLRRHLARSLSGTHGSRWPWQASTRKRRPLGPAMTGVRPLVQGSRLQRASGHSDA